MDKDKRIEELEKENQQLHKKIEELSETIKLLNARIFGKKTEKLDKNQLSFFSEAELEELDVDSDISSKENKKVEVELRVVRHRKVKPRGQRAEFLDTLVQVDVVHDLEQKNCADCHEKLTLIGKKCVYREVGLKQPELFCRNHYQQTYKCENCHPKGGDKIVAGKVPTSPIFPHSYFSSSVLAQVVTSKYLMAVPLNRQAIFFKYIGLPKIQSIWHVPSLN